MNFNKIIIKYNKKTLKIIEISKNKKSQKKKIQ